MKTYKLILIFDKDQTSSETFLETIEKVLFDFLPDIEVKMGKTTNEHPTLSLRGDFETIDSCHTQINKIVLGKLKCKTFRLVDEVGDELRHQAFLILAEIEQDIRAFINYSIIYDNSFAWWLSIGGIEFIDIFESDQKTLNQHHPLELTTFDNLVSIITKKEHKWSEDENFSIMELSNVAGKKININNIRNWMEEKGQLFSFSEEIFLKKFNNIEILELFISNLSVVINIRNAVMHHRPLSLAKLELLKQKQNDIQSSIAEATNEISLDEEYRLKDKRIKYRELMGTIALREVDDEIIQIQQSVYTSKSIKESLEYLQNISEFEDQSRISYKSAEQLKLATFNQIREFSVEDIKSAENIITSDLLPLCIPEGETTSPQAFQFRSLLSSWINQYEGNIKKQLREKIISYIIPSLDSDNPETAIWTISTIGYRTDEIVEKLWSIVESRGEETGDIALSSLTSLGVLEEYKEKYLEEAHRRVPDRFNRFLANTLIRLNDPSSIDIVLQNWSEKIPEHDFLEGMLIISPIIRIADNHSDNSELQESIWKELSALKAQYPDQISSFFEMSDGARKINSAQAPKDFISWMNEDSLEAPNPSRRRYLWGLRLEESVYPHQLEGMSSVFNENNAKTLLTDATQNTKYDGMASTFEGSEKIQAWKTFLRMGYLDSLNHLEDALSDEDGRYTQQGIIELISHLKIEPLPEFIGQLIIEEYNQEPEDTDGREIARRMAASRMAQNLATEESFELLLNFGYTHNGVALSQSTDHLASVALHLTRSGNKTIIDQIITTIEKGKIHHRTAAAFALETIVTELKQLEQSYIDRIIPFIYDNEREDYERATILLTLKNVEGYSYPQELLEGLENWVDSPHPWMEGASLEILAETGNLVGDEHLMKSKLGLNRDHGSWVFNTKIESISDWAAYIIGYLYKNAPKEFLSPVTEIITNWDWRQATQIINNLEFFHDPSHRTYHKAIVEAIVERINKKITKTYIETDVFDSLSHLDSGVLINSNFQDIWDNWASDAKVAYANAIGYSSFDDKQSDSIALLSLLFSDSVYAVRRSAYRAIANLSQKSIIAFCNSSSDVITETEQRKRAAEACEWLAKESEVYFQELFVIFQADTEPEVRTAVNLAWENRRKRLWANDYTKTVLAVSEGSNDELNYAWKYGEALVQIGDDNAIRTLRQYLRENVIPPNVRSWMIGIINKLENNWRKATNEWPDPWLPWEGTIENGKGKFNISGDEIIEVDYSIWSNRRTSPTEKSGWGGAVWPVPFFGKVWSPQILTLADGRSGNTQLISQKGDIFVFQGTGGYPE